MQRDTSAFSFELCLKDPTLPMSNPFNFVRQVIGALAGATPTQKRVELREFLGPDAAFSIMAPTNWLDASKTDRLAINAPDDGPALSGSAWLVSQEVTQRQFADARFEAVKEMHLYSQVGDEYSITDNGSLVREYQGRWPGDRKMTSYVVICLCAGSAGVAVTLTSDLRDYRKNRSFYRAIFASLQVLSNQPKL
jgi:hypothetical protein